MVARLTMSNVFAVKPPSRLPADCAKVLREIADRMDRGEVTEFVAAMVSSEYYEFVYPSSPSDSLLLSTLLQAQCLDKMRR